MQHSEYHYTNAIEEDEDYEKKVQEEIHRVFLQDLLPIPHIQYLENLKNIFNINPPVIYDIGSCTLHWERHAHRLWPGAKIYCFDAFDKLRRLYQEQNINYNICCLGNKNGCEVKFYQNDFLFGGNSYHTEKNEVVFPPDKFVVKKVITLDKLFSTNKYHIHHL